MQHSVYLLLVMFLLAPILLQAKHVAPPSIQSITNQGVRYVVPNDKGLRAYVEAWDLQTGRKLWVKTIFTHWYIPPFGTECMHYEYLTSMVLEKEDLMLTSDRGRVYALDVRTRTVNRMKVREPKGGGNEPSPRRVSSSVNARYRKEKQLLQATTANLSAPSDETVSLKCVRVWDPRTVAG